MNSLGKRIGRLLVLPINSWHEKELRCNRRWLWGSRIHAFKFAALIGRILGDLALDGDTPYPIEAFRLERPAITNLAFEETFHV